MAEKEKQLRQPAGIAGLVDYRGADRDAIIQLKPIHVVGIVVAFIIITALLLIFVAV